MSINLQPAIRAKFWKQLGYGNNPLPAPADRSPDNGYQYVSYDPNGIPINTYKESSGIGHFLVNNPNGTVLGGGGVLPTPGAPTVTPTGGSATTWGYKIVARGAAATTAAGTVGQTTTGAATLTSAAFNTITWAAVVGATSYDIYRTTASGTPSTTGKIGNTTLLTLLDTGQAGDTSTAPTVNTTGAVSINTMFDTTVIGLASPQLVAVTPKGTVGSTGYTYVVSAVTQVGTQNPATGVATTTGNATLTTTNFNQIAWSSVPGAFSYNIYRSASSGTPGTTGLIGNVQQSSAGAYTFNDTGIVIISAAVPTANNTGASGQAAATQAVGTPNLQVAHATYSFAVDGGVAGLITPAANFTLPPNAIIYNEIINWTTAGVGAGASASIGTTGTGGGAAILQAVTAVASLTGIVQGVIVPQTASGFKKLTTAGQATITISGANLTAGVCEIYAFYVASPS